MPTDLPSIFDSAGRFVAPDPAVLDALDPAVRERLDVVRQCYDAARAAEQAVNEISERLTATVKRLRDLEALRNRLFGPPSFHSLWKETFGR